MEGKLIVDFDGLKAMGIDYTRQGLALLVKRGDFPAPLKLGGRSYWLKDEVIAAIHARAAARPQFKEVAA